MIATLALGLGATTAILAVVDAVLLRPLPYPDGDRLVYLRQPAERVQRRNLTFSIPEIDDFRAHADTLDAVVDYSADTFTLLGDDGEPSRVAVGIVGSQYFDLLGLRPLHGRALLRGDDDPSSPPVAVMTHEYWQRAHGGDQAAIGATLDVVGESPVTVVGVLEPGAHYSGTKGLYVNTAASAHHAGAAMQTQRRHRMTEVYARLAPGVTVDDARRELRLLVDGFHQRYPDAYPESLGLGFAVSYWSEELTREARPMLWLLMGTAGLILLIVCANATSLTLAQAVRCRRDQFVRAASGATRSRLRLERLVTSAVMTVFGLAAGVGTAGLLLGLFSSYASRYTVRSAEVALDGRVLGGAVTLALFVALVVGAAPKLLYLVGAEGTRGSAAATRSPQASRTQKSLVVVQVALSFTLLVGVGLLTRSLVNLAAIRTGLGADQVLSISLPPVGQGRGEEWASDQQLVARVSRLPGVSQVAMTSAVPFQDPGESGPRYIDVRGERVDLLAEGSTVAAAWVTPQYFVAIGMPLLSGRGFSETDVSGGRPVAVVNEALARRFFPGEDPVGQQFTWSVRPGVGERTVTVVGLVANTRVFGLHGDAPAAFYEPAAQGRASPRALVVRAQENAAQLAPAIRALIREGRPLQPIGESRTLAELHALSYGPDRVNVLLFGAFAAIAITLAMFGLWSLLSYVAAGQRREFGIRLALGERPVGLFNSILRMGLAVATAGLVLGGLGAWGLSRALASLLFEVDARDPITFAAAAMLVVASTTVSAIAPARRAMGSDPADSLRSN